MYNFKARGKDARDNQLTDLSTHAGSGPLLTIQSPLFKRHGQNSTVALEQEKPQVWRKIAEAHAGHKEFLDKLGLAEKAVINAHARFLDSKVTSSKSKAILRAASKVNLDGARSTKGLTVQGIPWRRKDPATNPLHERQKIFESFNRTSGELPRTPPSHDAYPKRAHPILKNSIKTEKKTLTFNDDLLEYHRPAMAPSNPYANTAPKVDTGLSQLRKSQPKFLMPTIEKPHHHPLTIAPRLPPGFGQYNYDTFRTNRQATIDNVTERLYNNLGYGRPPRGHGFGTQQRHPFLRSFEYQQHSHTNFNKDAAHRMKFNHYDVTHMNEYLGSNRGHGHGSNPIHVLRAPVAMDNPSTTSTSYHPSPLITNRMHNTAHDNSAGLNMNQNNPHTIEAANNAANNRQRRYRPSQLMPLHIPGPKYDNIYIGPYSGSESDRDDEDNMDRKVKSRKR